MDMEIEFLYREGSEIANGPRPKNGIWGGTALCHDAEFGIRQAG